MIVPAAAARFVLTIIFAAVLILSPVSEVVEQPLKPNQQNHKSNAPSPPSVILWPGIALAFPSFPYLPIRGPTIAAPRKAATPPTRWIAVEPAKSWKPSLFNHPALDHIQ